MRVCLHVPGAQPVVLLDTADEACPSVVRIGTDGWGPGYSVFMEGERDATRQLFLGWAVILSTSRALDDDWVVCADDGRTRLAFDDECIAVSSQTNPQAFDGCGCPKQVFDMRADRRAELQRAWAQDGAGPAELFFVVGRAVA